MNIQETAGRMKMAAPRLAAADNEKRCRALLAMKEALLADREKIFEANGKDLAAAEAADIAPQIRKRLKFDEGKLKDVCAGIDQLISLPDPLGKITLDRMLDEGLELKRISVPIGVIGVIFEARPDALVQISSLCIRSGNCVILKGGKETAATNRALSQVISAALKESGMPEYCFVQVEDREEITALLACDKDVDLIIPRGSNAFVRYIMDHTRIPVMGHSDGICHLYVDEAADTDMALRVITDAKTQYPVACNAVETVLVHSGIAEKFLPLLSETMKGCGVTIHGDDSVKRIIGCEPLGEDGFRHEYLGPGLTAAVVENCREAVDHINRYGSHHTDGIITGDREAADYFARMTDSAGVYHNCSTRFADGFRYGFGAEVGISTGKLHARGPVGLEGLVTYKYCLEGSGQIVGDYASGKSSFHFKEVQP